MARNIYDEDHNFLGKFDLKSRRECFSCGCCRKTYESQDTAICKNCCKTVGETVKKHLSQIENLRSTVSFFRSSLRNPLVSPPRFSDVVLIAADDSSGQPIPANRLVLAGRSPVFRAMLENEMSENITGTIEIGEVSYDALRVFVSFLYTAEAVLDAKLACDLLVLAEKYEVPHLKSYCEKYLKSVLTWENSLPIYVFARQNNSDPLVAESLSLILKNMPKLSQRKDYAKLLETDPRMVVQIYEAYKFQ